MAAICRGNGSPSPLPAMASWPRRFALAGWSPVSALATGYGFPVEALRNASEPSSCWARSFSAPLVLGTSERQPE